MGRLYTAAAAIRRRWLRLKGARTLGVRSIVIRRDGRVALVRHHYIDGWYLPGGGVDRGEGYAPANARELREEIGLAHFHTRAILGAYHATGEGRDDHVLVYVVEVDEGEAAQIRAADPREIAEVRWCDPADPPPGTSPATVRRLKEFAAGSTAGGRW